MEKKQARREKGITLVALVITIIVLIILAGVAIMTLTGEEGILTKAKESRISTELSAYQEELETYKASKYLENNTFLESTLTAGKENLTYYTQDGKGEETGNIRTILKNISDEYFEKLEVVKGELLINTKDRTEIKIAQSLGIAVNPYDIEDGVLQSSDGNLLLMDQATGTLTIPDSVTAIGEGAFANVEGLKTIIIPSTVKRIETNAFRNNQTLETVIMQEKDGQGVEYIGSFAFMECQNLTTVQMANTVKEMGAQAFYYCTNLMNIKISTSLNTIENYVFAGCRNLKQIEFPEGIININGYAFSGCNNLETVIFSNTIETISGTAFIRCNNLKNIEIAEGNENLTLENGILLCENDINKRTEMIIILEEAIDTETNTFVVPDSVTFLQNEILDQYTNITTVQIPASVQTISPLFIGKEITNVIIVNPRYEVIGNAVYTKGTENEAVTMVRYFGNEEIVNVKTGTEIIGEYCFQDKNLSQIILPETLEEIKPQAFLYCNNLKSLSLGEKVKTFSAMSIYGSGIGEIILSENHPYFRMEEGAICNGEKVKALYNKEGTVFVSPLKVLGTIETYEIPSSVVEGVEVKEIADKAFHNQNQMKNIVIPSTVQKIGDSFNFCSSLEKIEIPSSVTTIHNDCFSNATNLKEIIIHNTEGAIANQPWGCIYGDKAVHWVGN